MLLIVIWNPIMPKEHIFTQRFGLVLGFNIPILISIKLVWFGFRVQYTNSDLYQAVFFFCLKFYLCLGLTDLVTINLVRVMSFLLFRFNQVLFRFGPILISIKTISLVLFGLVTITDLVRLMVFRFRFILIQFGSSVEKLKGHEMKYYKNNNVKMKTFSNLWVSSLSIWIKKLLTLSYIITPNFSTTNTFNPHNPLKRVTLSFELNRFRNHYNQLECQTKQNRSKGLRTNRAFLIRQCSSLLGF